MPRRKHPKHLTPTPFGTRARIRIHGVLHQRHFHRDVNPQLVTEWLLKTQLKYGSQPSGRRTGKFADDARAYVACVRSMPTYAQRAQHIREWVAVFGEDWRDRITPDQIAAQLAVWRQTKSASSVNKRRTALMHLYSVLDGKAEREPCPGRPAPA